MKQQIMIFTTTIALAATTPVLAEFRLGGMIGNSVVATTPTDDSSLAGGGTDSGSSTGVFGQWRTSISDTVDFGIHLGYFGESAKEKSELGTIIVGTVTATNVTLEVEADSTYDVLGLVAWKGGTVRPFMMAGYSSIKVSSDATGTVSSATVALDDSDSATGLKIAIGAEFPLSNNWSGYAMIDYVDYGKIDLYDKFVEADAEQTNLRLGVSYNF